jgi:hypothetical protein
MFREVRFIYKGQLYIAHAITILSVFQMNTGKAPPLVATDMTSLIFYRHLIMLTV